MNKLGRFIKTVLVYFIGNVLSKLVSFFLLPLYTSYIPPEPYGTYDFIITFLNLFAPILFFQVWDGMFRRSFDFENTSDKYKIINNAFSVCMLGGALYFILFSATQLFFSIDGFIYVLIYGFFFSIHYFYNFACRVFLSNKLLVNSGFINTVITAVVNIVLIVCFGWGIESLYLAPSIGTLVQIVIIEFRLKIIVNFKFKDISRAEIKKMVLFSLPLCVTGVCNWLFGGFTRVIITTTLSTYDNGLYAVANKFATMITLLVTVFQYAWNELAYLMANDKNRIESYNICIDILLKFIILGGAALFIFFKIIFPYFIDAQYIGAMDILPATVIGVMFNAMAGFISTFFMTENNTVVVMVSTLIAAAFNIALGFLLSHYFGLLGAIIALAVAYLILLVIRLIQARQKFKIGVSFLSVIILTVILALAVAEFYLSDKIIFDVLSVLFLCLTFILSMKKYIVKIKGELKKGKQEKTDAQ